MPFAIEPPIAPMLAKIQDDIPEGPDWLYEPKWDGFRTIVFKDSGEVQLYSRDERPMARYYPELLPVLEDCLPDGAVVDGEIVITSPKGLDFDSLLLRIHPAQSRVALLSRESPAFFIAFDLLAVGDENLCDAELTARRERLERVYAHPPMAPEELAVAPAPGSALTAQTRDVDEARRWLEELEGVGLDGVIAKRPDLPYRPGQRAMIKVKQHRTADCVVGGYRLAKSGDGIGSLLLGLYDAEGVLHYVGHTSSFKAKERVELLERLKPLEGEVSFGGGRVPGGPSRWTGGRDTAWVEIRPELVCEVMFDHFQGDRFRHAARFLRWRADKPPHECNFDQVFSVRRRDG